jgi:hypothetical protein
LQTPSDFAIDLLKHENSGNCSLEAQSAPKEHASSLLKELIKGDSDWPADQFSPKRSKNIGSASSSPVHDKAPKNPKRRKVEDPDDPVQQKSHRTKPCHGANDDWPGMPQRSHRTPSSTSYQSRADDVLDLDNDGGFDHHTSIPVAMVSDEAGIMSGTKQASRNRRSKPTPGLTTGPEEASSSSNLADARTALPPFTQVLHS